MSIILGVDPGLRACGWGVISHDRGQLSYLACGTIKPATRLTMAKRLLMLHEELQKVITAYQPTESSLEETFVTANGQSTLKLGQARGAIMLSLASAELPVSEYAARLVKKTVCGNGRAEKEQIQQMIKFLLPKSDADSADSADALAIAICHAHHHKALASA